MMEMSLFRQGCLHMLHGRYQEALDDLLAMAQLYPQHPETRANLGTCYLQLNKLHEAVSHYLAALTLVPDDTQILFNLGVINMKMGDAHEAINYYEKVIIIEPDYFAAHNNLGVAFLSLHDRRAALRHFRAALRVDPSNTAVRHTVSLLENRAGVMTSPPAYVKSLFDSYADHYDDHLRQALHYNVPEAMYSLVVAHALNPARGWKVLDLGCGTGLCGELFKPLANQLIGVDLSSGMLNVAHEKCIYNELHEAEVIDFMRQYLAGADLVVAGDVLVYIGQLDELMSAVTNVLNVDGWFVFSVETGDSDGVELMNSGRFVHGRPYIEELAARCGLRVVADEVSTLRMQQDAAVSGRIYLMQKLSATLSSQL